MAKKSILFVCLGNICRSPLGQGIFEALVEKEGIADRFHIDSCGTGAWHIGQPPLGDTQAVAKERGILSLESQRARKLEDGDFEKFDLLVAMDRENFKVLQSNKGKSQARLVHMREYDSPKGDLDVPDPYYTGDFDEVFDIIHTCCVNLLEELKQ